MNKQTIQERNNMLTLVKCGPEKCNEMSNDAIERMLTDKIQLMGNVDIQPFLSEMSGSRQR